MAKTVDPRTGEVLESDATFTSWLAAHGNGIIDDELTSSMQRGIAAARAIDKTAVLSVKVKIKPEGGGVILSVSHDLMEPQQDPVGKFYFAGDDGMPSRRDPNQPRLPMSGADDGDES